MKIKISKKNIKSLFFPSESESSSPPHHHHMSHMSHSIRQLRIKRLSSRRSTTATRSPSTSPRTSPTCSPSTVPSIEELESQLPPIPPLPSCSSSSSSPPLMMVNNSNNSENNNTTTIATMTNNNNQNNNREKEEYRSILRQLSAVVQYKSTNPHGYMSSPFSAANMTFLCQSSCLDTKIFTCEQEEENNGMRKRVVVKMSELNRKSTMRQLHTELCVLSNERVRKHENIVKLRSSHLVLGSNRCHGELFDHFEKSFYEEVGTVERAESESGENASENHRDVLCMVFDECKYGSLTQYLSSESMQSVELNENHVVHICRHVLSALALLHDEGIVHFDVKSDNLLVDENFNIVLSDFGASVQRSRRNSHNTTFEEMDDDNDSDSYDLGGDMLRGTPHWISPEMISAFVNHSRRNRNNNRTKNSSDCIGAPRVNTKADIWSFGILVYELLNNLYPPLGHINDHVQVLRLLQQRTSAPQLPEEVAQMWSHEMLDFMYSALTMDPEERPSAKQLLQHSILQRDIGDVQQLFTPPTVVHIETD